MKYYLLSICIYYPLCIVSQIVINTLLSANQLAVPLPLAQAANLYLTLGIIILLVDLWRSKRVTDDDKIWWTIVLFLFGFLLAPLYWFMVINKEEQPAAEQQPGA